MRRQNEFNFSLKCIYEPFRKCIKLKGYIQMLLVIISVFLKGESGLGRGGGEGCLWLPKLHYPYLLTHSNKSTRNLKRGKQLRTFQVCVKSFVSPCGKCSAMFMMAPSIYADSPQSTHAGGNHSLSHPLKAESHQILNS